MSMSIGLSHNEEKPDTQYNHIVSAKGIRIDRQWPGKYDCLLACWGCTLGLGNIWRFPYIAYKNGGGAFLIPYFVCVIFIGMPMLLLEMALGQFNSCGPSLCWQFCRIFEGCGFAMNVVSTVTCIYYNVIIAWALFFFYKSFASRLPWEVCGSWSSKLCIDRVRFTTKKECLLTGRYPKDSGLCEEHNVNNHSNVWIWDPKAAAGNGSKPVVPANDYIRRVALGNGLGYDIHNTGTLQSEITVCLLFSWIFVAILVLWGIKASAKIVYITFLLPYIVLVALLAEGVRRDGADEGIDYYLTPDISFGFTSSVWKDAAVQVFFSLSVAYGGLITLSSYNKFHNDILRDTIVVTLSNSVVSFLAGLVTFAFLGILAQLVQLDIATASDGGPTLAFEAYMYLLTKLQYNQPFSCLFFVLFILVGLDSQCVLVQTVITSITDSYPFFRRHKYCTILFVCIIMYLLGIPLTTKGGVDIVHLLDLYSTAWTVICIAICELTAVCVFYGVDRFIQEICLMIGGRACGCCVFASICRLWWKACLTTFTPLLLLYVMINAVASYEMLQKFDYWAHVIRWAFFTICIGGGFVKVVCIVLGTPGENFSEVWYDVTTPSLIWGPVFREHRALAKKVSPEIELDVMSLQIQTSDDGGRFEDATTRPESETGINAESSSGSSRFDKALAQSSEWRSSFVFRGTGTSSGPTKKSASGKESFF